MLRRLEALPTASMADRTAAGARAGLGAGEVPRTRLTASDVTQIVQAEIPSDSHRPPNMTGLATAAKPSASAGKLTSWRP